MLGEGEICVGEWLLDPKQMVDFFVRFFKDKNDWKSEDICQVQQQLRRQEREGILWSKTYELVKVEKCVEFENVLYYLVEWDGGTKSWIDGLHMTQQLEFWKDKWKAF